MRVSSQRSVRIQVAFRGHLQREQLLDREDEDELVVLEGDVVDPLRVRDRLPPRLLLHVLLEAGVEVADDGPDADDRSPSRSTTRRRTPCVDGWFGPKLTWRMSSESRSSGGTSRTVGIGDGIIDPR